MIERKNEDEALRVKVFLRQHERCDIFILFAVAYFDQNRVLDKYEVQSKIDRFCATGEVPAYVTRYMDRQVEMFGSVH